MLRGLERRLLKKEVIRVVALAVCLLIPGWCAAEVSDKMASLTEIWGIGLGAALAGFLGAYFRPWTLFVLATVPAYWFITFLFEIHFSDIAPALRIEQGVAYYVQTYAAMGFWLFALLAGLVLNKRRSPAVSA
jgi:hypothetical protein